MVDVCVCVCVCVCRTLGSLQACINDLRSDMRKLNLQVNQNTATVKESQKSSKCVCVWCVCVCVHVACMRVCVCVCVCVQGLCVKGFPFAVSVVVLWNPVLLASSSLYCSKQRIWITSNSSYGLCIASNSVLPVLVLLFQPSNCFSHNDLLVYMRLRPAFVTQARYCSMT